MNQSHAREVDLSTMFTELETRRDVMLFLIDYPNMYHKKNQIIIVCDKAYYESLGNEEKEIYISMNAYINLVHRKARVYNLPSSTAVNGENSRFTNVLHWVWFRKGQYQLKEKQMDCVRSWVELNPELTFNLWTDIESEAELKDFVSGLKDKDQSLFLNGTITVKYLTDTVGFVDEYFKTYSDDKAIRLFDKENFRRIIAERDNSNIMIAKTDFLRAMLLHSFGGFYADFNDCQCIVPIRYWMRELYKGQELIWPCDTFNPKQISNYFIYVPKGSKKFEKYHYNTMGGFKGLWSLMKVEETKVNLAKIYIDMTKKYLKKLKNTETTQPTKLLVETIMPVYGSGKYLTEIEDMIGKAALKGIEFCDPRGRVFLPMFALEFLADHKKNKPMKAFYKNICAEFTQIGNISFKRNFDIDSKEGKIKPTKRKETPGDKYDIMYMNRGYYEEYDDIEDDVLPYVDEWLESLNDLYDDAEFQQYFFKKWLSNMSIAVVALTNLMLQNDCELTVNDVVPFSFAHMSFCYLTLVVHWGEGTSIGGNE